MTQKQEHFQTDCANKQLKSLTFETLKKFEDYTFEYKDQKGKKKIIPKCPQAYIYSLAEIGLKDVFSYQDSKDIEFKQEQKLSIFDKQGKVFNTIYPGKKYNPQTSPTCTFLPSNRLLLQVMRNIIYVKEERELVYNLNGFGIQNTFEDYKF